MKYNYNWAKAFEEAREGNRKLLDEHMVKIHRSILWPYIKDKSKSKVIADELCSSVIAKFWERFYVNKEPPPKNIGGYLYTMARNALYHYDKLKANESKIMLFMDGEKLKNTLNQYSQKNITEILYDSKDDIMEQRCQALEKAFDKLGERCKELLKMNIIEKKKIRNIAPLMGFPSENAATQKKVSCMKKLRKLIYLEIHDQKKLKNV